MSAKEWVVMTDNGAVVNRLGSMVFSSSECAEEYAARVRSRGMTVISITERNCCTVPRCANWSETRRRIEAGKRYGAIVPRAHGKTAGDR